MIYFYVGSFFRVKCCSEIFLLSLATPPSVSSIALRWPELISRMRPFFSLIPRLTLPPQNKKCALLRKLLFGEAHMESLSSQISTKYKDLSYRASEFTMNRNGFYCRNRPASPLDWIEETNNHRSCDLWKYHASCAWMQRQRRR